MRKPITFLTTTAALAALLNLSGCMSLSGDGPFHGDHGDLVSNDGTVKYVGWCKLHPRNANCAPAAATVAAASSSTEETAGSGLD